MQTRQHVYITETETTLFVNYDLFLLHLATFGDVLSYQFQA